VIYASTKLTHGELNHRLIEEYDDDFRLRSRDQWHELFIKMNQYVIVFGDSYAECWQRLQQVWSPAEPEQPAIENRKEIEGA
jgi:hypothetical protein